MPNIIERAKLTDLKQWVKSDSRKPLVIRGARQVGKTWIVRRLAELSNKKLIEYNFEKSPEKRHLFDTNDVERIRINIEADTNQSISAENSLLFLDEIQAVPELLSKLRWFAEDLPQLPVIAAGSLLEFVLSEHTFSMPVGRINYLHLEPLSFEEFLVAKKMDKLFTYIQKFEIHEQIPKPIHEKLMGIFREYVLIGGLPAIVSNWVEKQSLESVHQIRYDLLTTYRDDFAKYSKRVDTSRLDEVLMSIPRMLGNKFVYSHVNKDIPSLSIKQALQLLIKARLCHFVNASHGNGIPLASEIRNSFFKVILLDTGLVSSALGIKMIKDDLALINQGGISEQVVGQLLRTIEPAYVEPTLYYWVRGKKGSEAEIDYLIQHESKIIPIEIKSGSTGSLKSLHLFMKMKNLKYAVRINADTPSVTKVNAKTQTSEKIQYHLLSIPFYLVGQIHRLLEGFVK